MVMELNVEPSHSAYLSEFNRTTLTRYGYFEVEWLRYLCQTYYYGLQYCLVSRRLCWRDYGYIRGYYRRIVYGKRRARAQRKRYIAGIANGIFTY